MRLVCASALAALFFTGLARAQPSGSDKAAADALFRAGKELLDAGKASEACPKLEESQRIDPRTGTLLNLAACHELEGRTASAWAEFNEAASQAASQKQLERERFARGKVEELERKLSKLRIVVPRTSAPLEIKIDGRVMRAAAADTAIPLDPGRHEIEVSSPGYKPFSKAFTIPEGPAEDTLEIPALARDAEEPAPARRATPEPPPPPPPSRASFWTPLGLGAFALGSAAIGAGAFFGLQTFSKRDDADRECVGSRCPQSALDTYDDARVSATLSTVSFAVGALLVAAGTYVVLFGPGRPRASVGVAPGAIGGRW